MSGSAGRRAAGIQHDLAVAAIPDDERVWVPQAPDVWFRPLPLNTDGATIGYEDVFTKLEMCRRHYAAVGLGAGYVDAFVR